MKVRPALGWISRALAVSGLIVLNAALLPAPALAETEYFVKLDAAGNPVEIFVVVDDVFTAMEQDLYGNSMTMGELLDLGNYLNSVEDAKKGADGKAAAEDGGAPEGTTDQETPRSDSDSELKSPCERQGNPVALATGEKYLEQTDFVLGGEYGMSLQRTYRSSGGGAMFGTKWSNNLQGIRLTWSGTKCSPEPGGPCAPAQVTTQEADYSRYTYTSPSDPEAVGVYSVQNNQAMGSIVYSQNGTWTMYRGRFVYGFASNGKLSTVKSSGGATLLTYVWGTYGPTSITNAVGQVVTFTWTSNRVTQVTLPGNKVWTYAYNGNGTLASVTAPGTPADVRSYHYENGSDATLLTGMSINGVRYSTYSYYPDKRVQQSTLTGGEQSDSFVYGAGTTTVTNALGQVSTYTIANLNGRTRISAVSRSGASSCPGASASTTYDANGYVDTKTDWNGNVSDYDYDANGRLTKLTTAAGTAAARTTAISWNGDNILQSEEKDAYGNAFLRKVYTYVTTGYGNGRLATETWYDLRLGGQRSWTRAYTFHANKAIATETVTEALPGGAQNVTVTCAAPRFRSTSI